ncbi:MAG: ABC transporter ATP-binding protein [Cytophagales bacterium]|nr:ABC transporter ATP-binding protein [Cytophagales bacterium]
MTVTTESLSKRFNREWIFRDFNHTFQPGIHAVTGPNGSGKSTLLQVLWGQLPATSGMVRYKQGEVVIPIEDIYKHLSFAAPYIDLMDELTLPEMLKFHFSFKKLRDGIDPGNLMDMLELSHAKNKQVGHFSSGMKQRLKLGLALFSDVKMIFMDEPTTNLDKESVTWYWKHFGQISPETIVFIGSNHESEYPATAAKINLSDYKQGYK